MLTGTRNYLPAGVEDFTFKRIRRRASARRRAWARCRVQGCRRDRALGPATAGRTRRRTGARLIVLGLAVIVIGSLAVAAVKHISRPPAALAARAAVRAQAAAWVAEQVIPDATVSCDAVMCAALRAHGFPSGKLVMLGPASSDPVPSDVIVQTAAVRALLGSSLATDWAPAVLASFGSRSGVITVRVVAPHGAAAYQASLRADLAGRKRSGAALLHHPRITVSAMARSQLASGQVDSRLLAALAALAGHQPVGIIQFGTWVRAPVPASRFASPIWPRASRPPTWMPPPIYTPPGLS